MVRRERDRALLRPIAALIVTESAKMASFVIQATLVADSGRKSGKCPRNYCPGRIGARGKREAGCAFLRGGSPVDDLRYSLVVMGPGASRYPDRLGNGLRKGFEDLGLSPDDNLQIVMPGDADSLDEHVGQPVGVWFGGEERPDPSHLEVVDRLQGVGAPILPLVEDITRFGVLVPPVLQPINGLQWDDPQIVPDVLRTSG